MAIATATARVPALVHDTKLSAHLIIHLAIPPVHLAPRVAPRFVFGLISRATHLNCSKLLEYRGGSRQPVYLHICLPTYHTYRYVYYARSRVRAPFSGAARRVEKCRTDVQRARTLMHRHACQIGATYIYTYIYIVVYIVVALFKSRGFTFVQDVSSSKRVHHVM